MFRPGNPVPQGGDPAAEAAGHRREGYGQPRPTTDDDAPGPPTAAERARTLVEGNSSAVLDIPGLSAADPFTMIPLERVVEGSDVLLRLPGGSPALRAAALARGDELTGVLNITDVAPVAVTPRVRGRAAVAGWLTRCPERTGRDWLRLETGEVLVEDLWGEGCVEPEEFAVAAADPLGAHEAELLQHLATGHRDELSWLGALAACDGHCAATGPAVPVALDRGGLRVRFTGGGEPFDVRFEFPAPVSGVPGLRHAMHSLFGAAQAAAGSEAGEG